MENPSFAQKIPAEPLLDYVEDNFSDEQKAYLKSLLKQEGNDELIHSKPELFADIPEISLLEYLTEHGNEERLDQLIEPARLKAELFALCDRYYTQKNSNQAWDIFELVSDKIIPLLPPKLILELIDYWKEPEKLFIAIAGLPKKMNPGEQRILIKGLIQRGVLHQLVFKDPVEVFRFRKTLGIVMAEMLQEGQAALVSETINNNPPLFRYLPREIATALARCGYAETVIGHTECFEEIDPEVDELCGVPLSELELAWRELAFRSEKIRTERTQKAAETVLALEKAEKGSVKKLMDHFGIHQFFRYSEGQLLRQLEAVDEKVPYGIMLTARDDHNGALDDESKLLGPLEGSALSVGYLVVAIECNSARELARRLVELEARNGPAGFFIVHAHGNPSSITLGKERGRGNSIRLEDIRGLAEGEDKWNRFLTPDAPITLLSCSTGVPEGIGSALSAKTKRMVTAPDKDTGTRSIIVEKKGDKIRLEVVYGDPNVSKHYLGGKELGERD